jgi:hypothetical protein
VLRTLHHAGAQRITFDISTHPEEMAVGANRDRLESTLIDCAKAAKVPSILPSSGVRHREPVHKTREPPIGFRHQDKMPMVRHDAVGKKCDAGALHRFLEKRLEGRVIARILEKDGAFGCSIKDVKYDPRRSVPFPSWHSASVRQP